MPLSPTIEVWVNVFGGIPTAAQFELLKDAIDLMAVALNGKPIKPESYIVPHQEPVRRKQYKTSSPQLGSELMTAIKTFASQDRITLAAVIREFDGRASPSQVRDLLIRSGIHEPQPRNRATYPPIPDEELSDSPTKENGASTPGNGLGFPE